MNTKEIPKKMIKPCLVSGLFYPDDREKLQNLLEEKLKDLPKGKDSLILTPHGSYSVCGETISEGFAASARVEPETVVLIGPVHRETAHPFFYLPEKAYFETPLGPLEVDKRMKNTLLEGSGPFREDNVPHMEEHSLEVQLPFIRYLYPEARILPILSGRMNRKTIRKAAGLLKEAIDRKKGRVLTVLTINLSNFLPLETAGKHAENLIEMMDFPLKHSLLEEETQGRISSCGPVVLTLASELFASAGKPRLLYRQNSRVNEQGIEKGVCYGSFSWPGTGKEE